MIKKKISFELFLGVWNTQQHLLTPLLHKRMASWLALHTRHKQKRLLLMAFRGSGKSTLVGLYCAWALCHDPSLRILVVAADEALAENMVAHVRHILETHMLARALCPDKPVEWARDRLTVKRTNINRDPSLRAAGITSNITGGRADIIICDDVEVPKTSDTQFKREHLRTRLAELDFILVPDGMILYLGTPHTEESLYKTDGFLKSYHRLSMPLNAQSWPERFTRDVITTIKSSVGPSIFASQMELKPVRLESMFLDPEHIGFYHDNSAPNFMRTRCAWDPAFGHARGDKSVVALVHFDATNRIYLHDILTLRTQDNHSDAATQQCAGVVQFILKHNIAAIQIESNGLGQFLPGLLRQMLKRENISCSVIVHHNTKPKAKRILEAFEAPLAGHIIFAHERIKHSGFLRELAEWKPHDANASDDALDAVASAILAGPRTAPSFTPFIHKGPSDELFSS